MTRAIRLGPCARAAGVALLSACSVEAGSGREAPPRLDAAILEAEPPGDGRDGDAEGEVDASAAAADLACAAPCDGTCTGGRCLVTLAQASSPVAVAVDLASAYFTSCSGAGGAGSVLRVPLTGGSPTTIASGAGCPVSLALGDVTLYVAGFDGSDITSVPLGGGTPTTLASGADRPVGVAADRASVYWTTSAGALMRVPLDGGAPVVLASGRQSATRPVLAGDDVYWGDPSGGAILGVPVSGGAPTIVVSAIMVTDLAIAGTDVVFADGYTLTRAPLGGGAPPTIIGTAGGSPLLAVAADDTSVYFASYSTLWKVPLGGGEAVVIASNQGAPSAIAVDATSVYWTNATNGPPQPDGGGGGQLMKLTPK